MTIWVKICGLTTPEAVEAAVAAGADAVGFVFAPSKRQVSAAQAVQLSQGVPRRIPRVAVMLHPTQSQLDEVWSAFRPDVLQTDLEDLATLRLPMGLAVMPVVRSGVRLKPDPQHSASSLAHSRVLFEGPVSGVGSNSDWNSAAQLARTTQLVLAGGLNATNLADALAAVRPFGVDVSSGVETAPGIKDPARIHEFVRRARAVSERSS
ncbi:MAG TPA: phosphoribosylanthranilate isomerase [Steroidobacteraceae bacterium]